MLGIWTEGLISGGLFPSELSSRSTSGFQHGVAPGTSMFRALHKAQNTFSVCVHALDIIRAEFQNAMKYLNLDFGKLEKRVQMIQSRSCSPAVYTGTPNGNGTVRFTLA